MPRRKSNETLVKIKFAKQIQEIEREQPAFPLREFFKNIYFYKILIFNPRKTNISYLTTLGFSGLVVSVNIVEFLPSSLVADCGGVLGLFIGFNFVMMWDLLTDRLDSLHTGRKDGRKVQSKVFN